MPTPGCIENVCTVVRHLSPELSGPKCHDPAPASRKFFLMPRSVNAVASRARRKRSWMHAGYFGARSKRRYTVSEECRRERLAQAHRETAKARRCSSCRLWIARINAAARQEETTYSRLINNMQHQPWSSTEAPSVNSRDLAMHHPDAFKRVVQAVTKPARRAANR